MRANPNHIMPYPIKAMELLVTCLLLTNALRGQEARYRLKAVNIGLYDGTKFKPMQQYLFFYSGKNGGVLRTPDDVDRLQVADFKEIHLSPNSINFDSAVVYDYDYAGNEKHVKQYFIQKIDGKGRPVNLTGYYSQSAAIFGGCPTAQGRKGYTVTQTEVARYAADSGLAEIVCYDCNGIMNVKYCHNAAVQADTFWEYSYVYDHAIKKNRNRTARKAKASWSTEMDRQTSERDSAGNYVVKITSLDCEGCFSENFKTYDAGGKMMAYSDVADGHVFDKKEYAYDEKGRNTLITMFESDYGDEDETGYHGNPDIATHKIHYSYNKDGLLVSTENELWNSETKSWVKGVLSHQSRFDAYFGAHRFDFEYEAY